MARSASVAAQAKVNLFLRILAREASGFHQLETLFQRLDLGDDVTVRVDVRGRTLDCRGADVGPVERNLAWRAAVAYADAAGWPDGFAIEIDKHIPVGGGLGGGSADAGAVLRCLDALAPEPLGLHALLAIGATLGADVPFLTAEAPLALAWGRGERMLALPALPPRRAHLACFDEGVHTAEAYRRLAEWRAAHGGDAPRPILWDPARLARWDDVALVATNDFEHVVLPMREDVAAIRGMFADVGRRLDALDVEGAFLPDEEADAVADAAAVDDGDSAPIALMSGSGATVFLLTSLVPGRIAVDFAIEAPEDAAIADAEDVPPASDDAGTDEAEAAFGANGGPGLRVVETRTADRVAAVSLSV